MLKMSQSAREEVESYCKNTVFTFPQRSVNGEHWTRFHGGILCGWGLDVGYGKNIKWESKDDLVSC